MPFFSHFPGSARHSTTQVGSQIASGDNSSGGGSPSLFVVVLIVFAAIWVISFFVGGAEPTVVIVQRPVGSLLGFLLLVAGIAVLYLMYIAPGSGPV